MIQDGVVKISDMCLVSLQVFHATPHGTPLYMPPEYFDDKFKERYTSAVDIWAFGVIMHELFFWNFPFNGVDIMDFKKKVTENEYKIPIWGNNLVSEEIK